MAEGKRREFTPITGQWADPEKVVCKDCEFRDRTVVELFGEKTPCGVTRGNCEIFKDPTIKPMDILLHGAPCQYYTKEKKATG